MRRFYNFFDDLCFSFGILDVKRFEHLVKQRGFSLFVRAVGNTTHTHTHTIHQTLCNYRGILNTGAGPADGGHQSRKQSSSDRQIPAARSLRDDNKTPSTSEQRRDRPTCWRWGVGWWLQERKGWREKPHLNVVKKEKKEEKKREEKKENHCNTGCVSPS